MNTWKVTLADQENNISEYLFQASWDHEKDFVTDELIARSAAAQLWYETGKRVHYVPISVELIPKEEKLVLQ